MSLEGFSCLVIDDDEEVTQVFRHVLESSGAKVLTAKEGSRALWLMDGQAFDVVISDLSMPKVDGLQLLSHATRHPKQKKAHFIVASGDLDADKERMLLQLGITDVLSKPVSGHVMLDRIAARRPLQFTAEEKLVVRVSLETLITVLKGIAGENPEVLPASRGTGVESRGPAELRMEIKGASFHGLVAIAPPKALADQKFMEILQESMESLLPQAFSAAGAAAKLVGLERRATADLDSPHRYIIIPIRLSHGPCHFAARFGLGRET